MAAPVLETVATTVTDATTTSITIAKPSGTASDNLLVAFLVLNSTPVLTPPSGWDLVDQIEISGGKVYAYKKVAGGSEPADYAWSWTGAQYSCGGIARISGVDTTTPINVAATSAPGATDTPSSPAVTTTVNDCLILRAIGCARLTSPYSYPTSTEDWDVEGTAAFDATSCASAHKSQAAAGGSGTETITAEASQFFGLITVAVAPAAGGAGNLQPWFETNEIIYR